jgi:hypothetical protein
LADLRQFVWLARRPRQLWIALRYVVTLPTLRVEVERPFPTADELPGWARYRPFDLHGLARNCIVLPSERATAFAGKSRHAFRKHIAAARREGFSSSSLSTENLTEIVKTVCLARGWTEFPDDIDLVNLHVPFSRSSGVACFDESGEPVAFAIGIRTADTFFLKWSYSTIEGHVRWLCLEALLDHCFASGIKSIINESAVTLSDSQAIFHRAVGFAPHNVVVTPRRSS